jgi:transposase
MAVAEAICEAAQRPTMRFVAVKSEAKQAAAVIFRARDLLVGQRTQIINALRGHLGEFGLIAPQGPSHVERLIMQIEDPASGVPEAARACLESLVGVLRHLQDEIAVLDKTIAARAKADEVARRLMTVPGIGPMIATAIEALAPPVETFRSGRDFAAWIGLTPSSARRAARSGLDGRRAWASERCDAFSSLPPARSYVAQSARVCRPVPGSVECLRESRRWSSSWHSPIRMPASPGRCLQRAENTELQPSPHKRSSGVRLSAE